jgi:Phage ABA sandwich domain
MENQDINFLVADKVMGWKYNGDDECWITEIGTLYFHEDEEKTEWNPVNNIYDAKDVLYMMQNKGFYSQHTDLTLDSGQSWWSWSFTNIDPKNHNTYKAQAETIEKALCLAALKALGAYVKE